MNARDLGQWLRRYAPAGMPPSQRRRTILGCASALAVSAITAPLASCVTLAPAFASDPFTLGVASGCPRPDSIVLWTRLAPGSGEFPPKNIQPGWEIAGDENFRTVARRGTAPAAADLAHS